MSYVGQPLSRVDGPAKVTGQATYAAEFNLQNLAHAALVTSTVPQGWITGVDASEAEHAPGVLAVIWHENAPKLPYNEMEKRPVVDPQAGKQLPVFQGPEVLFAGQPVALVIAESQEQARSAASLVRVHYTPGEAITWMDDADLTAPDEANQKLGRYAEKGRGDAKAAFAEAPGARRHDLQPRTRIPQCDGTACHHRRVGWRPVDAV